MSFVIHSIQSLLCLIDECIYNVASMLYSLLIYISESNLLKQEVIEGFATRLYVLLGVFMLFKVSFSLINYIVNPDDFTNGEKGVGKLVTSVMTTLVLIVLTPRIFAEALDLQHLITGQHFFEKIIFADNYEEQLSQDMGDKIANELFGAFYSYDTDPEKNSENRDGLPDDLTPLVKNLEGTTKHIYIDLWSAFDHDSPYNAYDGIWDDRSDYTALVSTAGGIILILVLIQFCFDIAIRVIKFGFLQLIAPIPIISRMDPKSAKNGLFSRWVKQCTKTYLDLFVRLLAVYFAIYLIQIFMNTSFEVPETNGLNVMIIKAILILGTLLFAKQLPKFIEDLFGINLSKGFTLNPMRRLREVPGFNRATGGLGSAYQNAVGAFQHQRSDLGANRGRAILSALGGAARGVVPGVMGGRGFRGQMNASKTAQTDLYDAAAKLRMQNPGMSEEEALRQARQDMRTDRRNERLGLRTSQDMLHREETELNVEKAAHEKKTKEEAEARDKEIREIRKGLDERKFERERQTEPLSRSKKAVESITAANKKVTDTALEEALSTKDGHITAYEYQDRLNEIERDKAKLEQMNKTVSEKKESAQSNLSTYKQQFDNVGNKKKQIESELAGLQDELNKNPDKKYSIQSKISKKQAELDTINTQYQEARNNVKMAQEEYDNIPTDDEIRRFQEKINEKEIKAEEFKKKIVGNTFQNNTIHRHDIKANSSAIIDNTTGQERKIKVGNEEYGNWSEAYKALDASIESSYEAMSKAREHVQKMNSINKQMSSETDAAVIAQLQAELDKLDKEYPDAEKTYESNLSSYKQSFKAREQLVKDYADYEKLQTDGNFETYITKSTELKEWESKFSNPKDENERAEAQTNIRKIKAEIKKMETKDTYYSDRMEYYSDVIEETETKLASGNLTDAQRHECEERIKAAFDRINMIHEDTMAENEKVMREEESARVIHENNREILPDEYKKRSTDASDRYAKDKEDGARIVAELDNAIAKIEAEVYQEKAIEQARRVADIEHEQKVAKEEAEEISREFTKRSEKITERKTTADAEHKASESRTSEGHNNNGNGRH